MSNKIPKNEADNIPETTLSLDGKVTVWMVRAGGDSNFIDEFLKKGIVAVGWNKVGDLSAISTLDSIKQKLVAGYPDYRQGQINNAAGQLFRFKMEIVEGEKVITYDANKRIYYLGEVTSDYIYSGPQILYPHARKVRWINNVSRDNLSTAAKNSLGSVLTIFKLPSSAATELLTGMPEQYPKNTTSKSEDNQEKESFDSLDAIKDDIEAKAHEFIKDKVLSLDWEQMQDLMAGVLRGMGYKTLVSPKGADRGKDIIASPDGLGLENPKILVEVKHRDGAMGSSQVRSFLGGLRQSDRGVYLSTGGFTKEAKYEAERATIPITLIDLELLVLLIVQHYDNFDSDTRSLVPLKKIYWPI